MYIYFTDRWEPMLIGEPISVLALFEVTHKIKPLKFRWAGKTYNIKEITYSWRTKRGYSDILHFSVSDGNSLYQLSFDTNTLSWRLENIDTENF